MTIYRTLNRYNFLLKFIMISLSFIVIFIFLLNSSFIFLVINDDHIGYLYTEETNLHFEEDIVTNTLEEKKEPELPQTLENTEIPDLTNTLEEKKEPELPQTLENTEIPEVIAIVMSKIISEKKITSDEIYFIELEEKIWNSNALGCPVEGMMYTQQIIDGYKINFSIMNSNNIIHSDIHGNYINCSEIELINEESNFNFVNQYNLEETSIITLETATGKTITQIDDKDYIEETIKKLNQDVIISNSKICIHKYNLIFKKKSEKISFGLVCENNLNYVYVDAPIESTNLFIKIIEPILANQEFPGVPKNE